MNKLSKAELKSAVIGMVMGDGCLGKHIHNDNNNAYFQMTHGPKQKDYMFWKRDILDQVSKCKVWTYEDGGSHLHSRVNPLYTSLYNRFYQVEGKGVDEYLVKKITPLALAIIYMDDGTVIRPRNENCTDSFFLRLCRFDYANMFLIKKSLKILYDLEWNIIKHVGDKKSKKEYWQLRLRSKDNDKFINIIKPYIIPSMTYKLGSYANTPCGGDIV